jgi:hypothetical protein
MSIATEISRIKSLRDDLSAILAEKNIISHGEHTLEEDVVALENFVPSTYNLQTKSASLGQDGPLIITPDSGYQGLSSLALARNSTYVKANYIKSGHKIMNVTGGAALVNNLRKLTWNVTINNSTPDKTNLILQSSNATCYPAGSFTPGDPFPSTLSSTTDKPFILYVRRTSSFATQWEPTRKEVIFILFRNNGLKNYGSNYVISPPGTYYHDIYGNFLSTGLICETSNNNTTVTITPSPSAGCIFYGLYEIELIY